MSVPVSPLAIAQEYLIRYGMTTYITLGDIGLLCNIAIFSQSAYRRNSCCLYILCMSFCSLIGLNSAVVPYIYGLNHPNPLSHSLVVCKLQYYLRHVFSQLMRIFFVLACADRYATSSSRPCIRSFSRPQVAFHVIPVVIIFWVLLGIFPTMLYSITNGVCDAPSGLLNIMYSVYIMIVLGILPLLSMFTFGILMVLNLKKVRSRIHPIRLRSMVPILRKRDRDMMRMLLVELSIYILTTIPNTIVLIYRAVNQNTSSTVQRQAIESLIYFIARVFLLYLNNGLSFWIYLLTSKSFRFELKNFLAKCHTLLDLKVNSDR